MKQSLRNLLLSSLVILLPITTALSKNIKQENSERRKILEQQGVLKTGDLVLPDDGSLYDIYDFEGKAGHLVKIIFKSVDFKATLVVFDGQGEIIAYNYSFDKIIGLKNNDFELVISLPQDDIYRLFVSGYDAHNKGKYDVRIIELKNVLIEENNYNIRLQSISQPKNKADKLYQQGQQQYLSRNWKGALQSWEQALFIYQNLEENAKVKFLQEAIRGLKLYLNARNQEKLGYLEEALIKYKKIDSILTRLNQQIELEGNSSNITSSHITLGKAGNFLDIGKIYFDLGKDREALENYHIALLNYQKIQDKIGQIDSYNFLGKVYLQQGNYPKALDKFQQALIFSKQINSNNQKLVSLINLGAVYSNLGRYKDAIEYKEDALKISRSYSYLKRHESSILNGLGLSFFALEDYTQALDKLKLALAINKTLDNSADEIGSIHLNLGAVYRALSKYDKALNHYKKALDIFQKTKILSLKSSVSNSLGLLYLDKKQFRLASQQFQNAITIRQQIGAKQSEAISISNLGVLYYSKGDYKKAAEYFAQVSKIKEEILTQNLIIGSERHKLDYIKTFKSKTDATVSLHLHSLSGDSELAHLAFTNILNRKGRILDILTNSQQILRQRIDDPESQTLLNDIISIYTQHASLVFKKPEDIVSPQRHHQQIAELDTKAKQLEDQLSRRSAEFRTSSQSTTLENIQKLIPNDSALIELFHYQPFNPKAQSGQRLSKPHYVAYILRLEGEPQVIDLGEAETIDKQIQEFRRYLRNPDTRIPIKQLKSSAQKLDELVMQPVRQLLGDTNNILLSPDADLNLIPFEALVDENNQYLVENYNFTYLTSGRDLLRLQTKYPSQQAPLVLANPQYNQPGEVISSHNNNTNSLRAVDDISKMRFGHLAETANEAQALQKLFTLSEDQVLTETKATENVLKQVKSPSFLHIATHGFFLAPKQSPSGETNVFDNPLLRSGLVFAGVEPRESGEEDGIMTAYETTLLNLLGTKLVVLSACDTGVGDSTSGEGIYGLRRALVIAGSESQVISLWKVNDAATKDLMIGYYQNLKAGQGRSEALHQIQRQMLRGELKGEDGKLYEHPYYWASFIPSGDWTPVEF